MNRIKSALIAAGAVAVLASPAMVNAGSPWDKIVKDKSRFTLLKGFNELAVRDNETGLVWERYPDLSARSWNGAQNWCAGRDLGGRMGWRLPSFAELMSLVDRSQIAPALPADHPFETPSGQEESAAWSATTFPGNSLVARYVFLYDGTHLSTPKTTIASFAWCVRGGSGYDGP